MAERHALLRNVLPGTWHLIPAQSPEGTLPLHWVELVFVQSTDGLQGFLVSRMDRSLIPMPSVEIDGVTACVNVSPPGNAQHPAPRLVLRLSHDAIAGEWTIGGERMPGPRLKLVRAIVDT